MVENTITILEGPPPIFSEIRVDKGIGGWELGLIDADEPYLNPDQIDEGLAGNLDLRGRTITVTTLLRTFNAPALVERCYQNWRHKSEIRLHYRNMIGLDASAQIIAAKDIETPDGHILRLWLRMPFEQFKEMKPPPPEDLLQYT